MEIRKLVSEEEFSAFTNLVMNAYPPFITTADAKQHFTNFILHKSEHDQNVDYYGLFQQGKLIAGMRMHYYEMNLFNTIIRIGGVGQIAVDLLHKKQHAAKNLMDYFLKHMKEKQISFVALYPFRPDFYKKMGFGYAQNMFHYSMQPSAFPKGPSKEHLSFVGVEQKEQLQACYNRYVQKTHGMMYKTDAEWNALFKPFDNRIVAFTKDGEIKGYIVFTFKKQSNSNFLLNHLVIKELIYETPDILLELTTFINSQADQVERVEWFTQDANIRFLTTDALNGSKELIPSVYHPSATTGIGLMYRIIDIAKFFEELPPTPFATSALTWQLRVNDSFMPENNVEHTLQTIDGKLTIVDGASYDVSVSIDISELSSLLMGVVSLQELYEYNKVQISDSSYLDELNTMLYRLQKPICTTAF